MIHTEKEVPTRARTQITLQGSEPEVEACCAATVQESCCAPSAKESCCGPARKAGSCGCQAS